MLRYFKGFPAEVVGGTNLRPPGYESWQQASWLAHCGDACEFHGDAKSMDIKEASLATKHHWKTEYKQNDDGWKWAMEGDRPGGSSAFYKFRCRH